MTPSTTASSISADNHPLPPQAGSFDDYHLPGIGPENQNDVNTYLQASQMLSNQTQYAQPVNASAARVEEVPDQPWLQNGNNTTSYGGATANVVGNMDLDWDLGGLFMVPANWPMNLPSPCTSPRLLFIHCAVLR